MRASVLLPVLTLLGAGTLAAQDFRWHAPLASGKRLVVRGISGEIRATRGSGGEAEVTAVKKAGRRGDPDQVEIRVAEDADGVTICAVYPSRRGQRECRTGESRSENFKETDVEVNFEVKVPAGVRFEGTTVNGDVRATDLPSDADVSTVNGDIDVIAGGTVQGRTVNGSIAAELGSTAWSGTIRFTTVNGGIRVSFPAGLSAVVDARTVNGAIDSDFPVTMQGRVRRQQFHGVIGEGGRGLELTTVNGEIELRKK